MKTCQMAPGIAASNCMGWLLRGGWDLTRVLSFSAMTLISACGGGGSAGCGSAVLGALGSSGCSEGGSSPTRASASISAPATAVVGNAIAFDGAASRVGDSPALSYQWTLEAKPASSAATLGNASSSKANLVPDLPGIYRVGLSIGAGSGSLATTSWTVQVNKPNQPPKAVAGAGAIVMAGSVVQLDGSSSSDPDGDLITYRWTLTSRPPGSSAQILDANTVRPRLGTDLPGSYVAALMVSDGTESSTPATVTISAGAANVAPVAQIQAPQSVLLASVVTLDATSSRDANGDLITYVWSIASKPNGSTAALSSTSSARPSFTPDRVGDYVFGLVVTDGKVASAPVFATVAATAEAPPTARAGLDQTVKVGAQAQLDGTGSEGSGRAPLTYNWKFVSKPVGSTATLSNSTASRPTFTPDVGGAYVVSLTVADLIPSAAPAFVVVTATSENQPPIAVAGPDISPKVLTTVLLDGGSSQDPDKDPITFDWKLVSRPPTSVAILSGATPPAVVLNTRVVAITPDQPGSYVISLQVSDGRLTSAPSIVTVTATANRPPVANAVMITSVTDRAVGKLLTLDGSGSNDPDGDRIVSYTWTVLKAPTGSSAQLLGSNAVRPLLIPDVAGLYVLSLIVSDGNLSSSPAIVSFEVAP